MSAGDCKVQALLSDPFPRDIHWLLAVHETLGNLATFWLNSEILSELRKIAAVSRQLGGCTRSLRSDIGGCHVLAVTDVSLRKAVDHAAVLPLQWRAIVSHDIRLPPGLNRIADRVKSELKKVLVNKRMSSDSGFSTEAIDRYSLAFPETGRWPDLRLFGELEQDFESAFGALALGLIGRINNCKLRQDHWISLAWQNGPKRVDGLAEKAKTAQQFPCEAIYATRDSFPPNADGNLYRSVDANQSDLLIALKDVLTKNLIDPLQGRSWKEAVEHADLTIAAFDHYRFLDSIDRVMGSAYYRSHLVPIVGAVCRKNLIRNGGVVNSLVSQHASSAYVCIAADRGDTERILLATWRPNRMVLFLDGSEAEANQRVKAVYALAKEIEIEEFSLEAVRIPNKKSILGCQAQDENRHAAGKPMTPVMFISKMEQVMRKACDSHRGSNSSRIVYDASGGTATMKSVMFSSVLKPGDLVITLESERTNPGSELYHVLEFQPSRSFD